ncbi:MAG: hypothetical protein ACI9N1_000004 [Flavobacteriales bacterium]|jgi:signal transduction histidine kinase
MKERVNITLFDLIIDETGRLIDCRLIKVGKGFEK